MCKFNQHLFIITIFWCVNCLIYFKTCSASPVDFMLLDDFTDEQSPLDHDITYDQRQNGTENLRLRIDGVIVAVPSASSQQASSVVGNLASNYLLQLASTMNDDDDDGDYFPFVKNSNHENGISAPTQLAQKDSAEQVKDYPKRTEPKGEQEKDNFGSVTLNENEHSNDVTAANKEHSKLQVVPVKKVHSRQKNRHRLRLGGLLDLLRRNKYEI